MMRLGVILRRPRLTAKKLLRLNLFGFVHTSSDAKQVTNLRVPLQWRDDRAKAESMRYETSLVSDSSHEYTPQGVKLLSSTSTEKAAEAGIIRQFYANVR